MSGSEPIEIFRAGTHTPMGGSATEFSTGFLDEIIENYDPKLFEAPVVKGHPKTDDPAFGWVKELFRKGDRLFATIRDVEPQFAEAVTAGRYRKVSSSFWMAGSNSPLKGKPYLRHVGVLGAASPA
ncbi:MAG: phage protease [Cohaesibacter sp.]|nr:phage protease [Cohaesibacter sp.]